MYWTKKSIYEGFDVHGFDSLAALCDEIFSLEKISHFSPENNASKYIFTVRNMKKIANEKEKEFGSSSFQVGSLRSSLPRIR